MYFVVFLVVCLSNNKYIQVIISQRVKKLLQSGESKNHLWYITWPKRDKWTNPLMGWTSGADPMNSVKVYYAVLTSQSLPY